jgi:N6-L-threonylcarbamoyladenine synthase
MKVLALETSCDDTGVALLDRKKGILASVLASQVDIHTLFGGVVPELAARKHLEVLLPLTNKVLCEGGISLKEIDCLGVTVKPGLVPALLVGLSFAKALAFGLRKPLIGVDHLEAHTFAIFLQEEIHFPFLSLVVSGGHTSLFLVKDFGEMYIVGQTRDDAAGEAFDKIAKLLHLGYPGGPVIDRIAKEGDPSAVDLPRPMLSGSWDFSFSGLKTAVVQHVKRSRLDINDRRAVADMVASFQTAVVEVLVEKTVMAAKHHETPRIVMSGGVAANSSLRSHMKERAEHEGLQVFFPPLELCSDNAAMVAYVAGYRFARGEKHSLDLDVTSRSHYPRYEP